MPDKHVRRLVAALHVALWIAALRHSLTLLHLGWANAGVLRWFASEGIPFSKLLILLLPLRRYAQLFRPIVLFPSLTPREADHMRRLHRRLNRAYAVHQPAYDPLTGPRARLLQAALVRNLFWKLFRIRLQPAEALAFAGYGSAGMAARDFLNYARSYGWSVAPTLPLQLFLSEVNPRHAKASSRQSILRTLLALAGIHRSAGVLGRVNAVWHSAKRLLCRAYWTVQDRHDRELRFSAAGAVHSREIADAVKPLRGLALSEQRSLLAILAHEMLWHAMDELLELRAQMSRTPRNSRRFEAARVALDDNLQSVMLDQFKEENENAREFA